VLKGLGGNELRGESSAYDSYIDGGCTVTIQCPRWWLIGNATDHGTLKSGVGGRLARFDGAPSVFGIKLVYAGTAEEGAALDVEKYKVFRHPLEIGRHALLKLLVRTPGPDILGKFEGMGARENGFVLPLAATFIGLEVGKRLGASWGYGGSCSSL
jgi:hypothetical protein